MTAPALEITFSYHIPDTVDPPKSLPSSHTSGSYSFPVQASTENGSKVYYEGLRKAIKDARDETGAHLTAWRDAVGDTEKEKEASIKKVASDDEEEEGGDES
ncbi:hypothetical protein FRB99_009013 [Tulasnella sp. 403]|nr:hypothetical protein FRB99_009013 [Tulasnella sp. 403]